MATEQKTIPGWTEVLESLRNITGDPLLLDSVKEKIQQLLIRSLQAGEYFSVSSCWKSLKKYGVVLDSRIPRPSGNALLDAGRFRALQQRRAEAVKAAGQTDWPEAIALARALDLLSGKMGTDAAVKDFLYKFKVLLWHNNIQRTAERLRIIFTYGKKQDRILAVWFVLRNQRFLASSGPGVYSLSVPPDLASMRRPNPVTGECHNSISSGQLNVFVLYAMSSNRPLAKADFWGIIAHKRIDFLEFLLVDLPNKKLPYSTDEIIAIAVSGMRMNEDFGLKVFQLFERIEPGKIASFTDRYGGNWLWYSLFILRPEIKGGSVLLSPLQNYLYSLCDHAKPNCDGISFDDLCGNCPEEQLQ